MARNRLRLNLTDYVVLAINPALVMALVGSLVFFLAEILYAGNYGERLRFVLFWFVVGTVAVTRVSLTAESADRTGIYGTILGIAVYVALLRFVEYPEGAPRQWAWLINIFLIGVVWWTAHCVTIDCTHLDSDTEIGNEGVLSAAGVAETQTGNEEKGGGAVEAAPAKDLPGWIERWQRYRAERRKKRTPGVWVVYYSLGALPLFGLGQSLIPAEAADRRRYTFLLLCVYVASGLGLLLTTAFLGLRRYLRQRGARMPAAMTGAWLTTGLVLIVLFLAGAAILPRPLAEVTLSSVTQALSQERDASRHGHGDSPGKGRGKPAGDQGKDQPDNAKQDGSGQGKSDKDAAGQGQDKNAKDGQGDKGQAKGGQGKDGNGKDGQGKDGQGKDAQGKDSGDKAKDASERDNKDSEKDSASNRSSPSTPPSAIFQGLATLLKWIVFAVLALVIVGLIVFRGLRFLSHFTAWARRLLDAWNKFWANLFGGGHEKRDRESASEESTKQLPPFAVFSDPFANGRAKKLSPRELTEYSFQALESWAAERKLGRAVGETPLEFTTRVADGRPVIESEIARLGDLFTLAAYGPGLLPDDCVDDLRKFWDGLQRTTENGAASARRSEHGERRGVSPPV